MLKKAIYFVFILFILVFSGCSTAKTIREEYQYNRASDAEFYRKEEAVNLGNAIREDIARPFVGFANLLERMFNPNYCAKKY